MCARPAVNFPSITSAPATLVEPEQSAVSLPPVDRRRSHGGLTRVDFLAMAGLLLFGVLVRLPTLNMPFNRGIEGMGAYYGIFARNYVRLGIWHHGMMPVQSVGISPMDPPVLYTHHPPLVPLLVALSYRLFGQGDWQTRLPAALCTLACAGTILFLLRPIAGRLAAFLAALLLLAVPISVMFGGQPDVVGSQLVLCCLITVAAYLRLHRNPSIRNVAILSGCFFLAAATDWPAFYLVPILLLHFCLTRSRQQRRWIWAFTAIAILIFVLLVVQLSMTAHKPALILDLFAHRSVLLKTDGGDDITYAQLLMRARRMVIDNFTIPVLVLAGGWFVLMLLQAACGRGEKMARGKPRSRSFSPPATSLVLLTLGWGVIHVVIGEQGVFVHDFWWWPLAPGLVIAAALLLNHATEFIEKRVRPEARSVMPVVLCMCVVGAGAWSARGAIASLGTWHNVYGTIDGYRAIELGRAVREAVPPNTAVLVAADESAPQAWYYADRPMGMNVWNPAALMAAMQSRNTDLAFGFKQPWHPSPAALVVPKANEKRAKDLLRYVHGRYRQIMSKNAATEPFLVFDLKE